MKAATPWGLAKFILRRSGATGAPSSRLQDRAVPQESVRRNGNQRNLMEYFLTFTYGGNKMMELADVRNALENTATKLADFRGSL